MNNVIPTIGSKGYFELSSPLDKLITPNEQYTCKGIRNLSDYLANNEDPRQEIYVEYGIESEYNDHVSRDVMIVSLQGDKGHWLYIPNDYIITYPIVNGVPYRSIAIGASLPSIPVNKDISHLVTDINNLITDYLGVKATIKIVETSRTMLIGQSAHSALECERSMISNGGNTDRSRYMLLLNKYNRALSKIKKLENFIKCNKC